MQTMQNAAENCLILYTVLWRRILCNLIGNDVENGEIPADMELLGQMVENICYNNAVEYFGIEL